MKLTIITRDNKSAARACELETTRSVIKTPVFMPVATRGAIRALTQADVESIGFDIILSNTYHIYMRPGTDVVGAAGGLHKFMNFSKSLLTDSGGFQVFSLSNLCKVKEDGVEFNSHLDGSKHFFTPEKVLDIQRVIGSDIMMVLDQCTDYPIEKNKAVAAMEKTISWAKRSKIYYDETFDKELQACFAIIQGSVFTDLRKECADRLVELDFPGYAIGGLSVGEPKELYREITENLLPHMPDDKPRYMMGVGSPLEILFAIRQGVDMFDCVMPTRIARNGTLYTSTGRVNIKAAQYEKDFGPLDENCSCYVCRNFSRAYLRHIFRAGEIAALTYNTYHNLHFMKHFMDEVRQSIMEGTFSETEAKWYNIFS
ncbi:MAG: tRNA guanosine(34) transglycosylase Tgt [Spirochaetae bacterium HGW-Spirochaetae-5]|nr:MAG: tRNA guanosine(34) transglycosylase Tgt [Spirochaetae bacterium HGW-Spirochaetae-5]